MSNIFSNFCEYLDQFTLSFLSFISTLNMAGPSSNIPVSDSYSPSFLESLFIDNQFNLLENMTPSFSSLLSNNPLEVNVPPSQPMLDVAPLSSKVQESTPVVTNINMSEAGPSRRPVKRCRNMAELMESTIHIQPSDHAPRQVEYTVQPRDPAPNMAETTNPFSCGCCHVLREIIHTNGLQYHKLEVHGRINMICHAIFHQDVQGGSSRPQMFDFSKKNIEEIKHFLTSYCYNQNSLGYVLVSDPLSAYYEALCVGLEWVKTQNEPLSGSFPINAEHISSKGKEPEVADSQEGDYSGLKLGDSYKANKDRRMRRESMSLEDFSNYFHLTLNETSKLVNLSCRTIRRICQRRGIEVWPHKKIQKLMRLLSVLTEKLPHETPISRVTIEEEIKRIQTEMVEVCGGVVPSVACLNK